MSFKERVVSSSKWAILNQLVTQGIRLVVSVYLMRLLAPESFGIFMKVLSIVGISEILVGLRMGGGIVQSKNINQLQLSVVFWMTFIGSILLALIFFLSGNLIALFYNDLRLVSLTQASSIFIVFLGIGYVPRSILIKKLDYKSIFISNSIGVVISSSIGIWMTLQGYDYWSLLGLWGSYHLIISVFYLLQSKFIPIFSLKSAGILKVWQFSKKIALNDSFNFFARNIDNIIIGRVLGAVSLGLYSRAYNIMLVPLQNFANIFNGVLFTSFSLIQDDRERIKIIFHKAIQSISFITLPFMLFIWFFANELVFIVFGEQWMALSGLLRILLILGIIQIHSSFSGSVFLALGRSDIPLKVSYFSKPILIGIVLWSVGYGISAVAIGVTIVSGMASLIILFLASSLIGLGSKELIVNLGYIWLINFSLFLPLIIINIFYPDINYDIPFMTLLFIFVMLGYYVVFELIKPKFYVELKFLIFGNKFL